ncbi:MAG: DUF1638 domain-containing protein [Thalassobaculum sp.]|uniref:DUF1638 domain-containing protein n=1 Tax=Thalassobaculum sp. TaxID=2022740 RepID=UPI0032EF191D
MDDLRADATWLDDLVPAGERPSRPTTLYIACGALARELVALKRATGWAELTITCLPAHWHNTPDKITPGVLRKIRSARRSYDRISVIYGDCGTGGELDRALAAEGVERIPGPHCYQFFMGTADFQALADDEPGCFFLTDYLVRHFDRLIVKGLGLDRHPELLPDYFGNYTKVVHLAQIADSSLKMRAEKAAARLGLAFEYRLVGYGELGDFVAEAAGSSLSAGL